MAAAGGNLTTSSGSNKPHQQTESVVTTVEAPSPGMFGWVKGSGLFSKMVEKTRSVTTNVITTLDPQMKEFIQSGGDIQVYSTVGTGMLHVPLLIVNVHASYFYILVYLSLFLTSWIQILILFYNAK